MHNAPHLRPFRDLCKPQNGMQMCKLRKQCAWCLIDLDTGENLTAKDLTASHGICTPCMDREMRAFRQEFNALHVATYGQDKCGEYDMFDEEGEA